MAPRLVPLLEVPEGPDDPSMPQILAMKFTFLRCQPQWELTIPPIKQAKPIGKHLGFQFPFIFKCPFLKFEFQILIPDPEDGKGAEALRNLEDHFGTPHGVPTVPETRRPHILFANHFLSSTGRKTKTQARTKSDDSKPVERANFQVKKKLFYKQQQKQICPDLL